MTGTVYGILCPHCGDQVWSRHRHDCHPCKCGYCYVDGGRDYQRVGYGGPKWPGPWTAPTPVEVVVADESPGEVSDDSAE